MNNLRFPFNHMPKWLLVAFLATIGLPIHLAIGLWAGLCEGVDSWRCELRNLRDA